MSGAKSDPADAHILADMVRTDAHQLRSIAADSSEAQAIKVVARVHKTLIWDAARHAPRWRHALREYFPAAVEAFEDLDAADTLELLSKAPDPASAAKLNRSQIRAALKHARRRDLDTKTTRIHTVLRSQQSAATRSSPARTRPPPARSRPYWPSSNAPRDVPGGCRGCSLSTNYGRPLWTSMTAGSSSGSICIGGGR